MAKLNSLNTTLTKYMQAYTTYWLKNTGITKTAGAERLGLTHGQFTDFINGKRSISIAMIERICLNTGKKPIDALLIGKRLCGEMDETETLTPFQIEALSAFRECLLIGGGTAEMIAQNAIDLVRRNQEKRDVFIEPAKHPQSKSA